MNFQNSKSVVVHTTKEGQDQFPIGYMPTPYQVGMVDVVHGVCLPVAEPVEGDLPLFSRIELGHGLDISKGSATLHGCVGIKLTTDVKHVHFAFGLAKAKTTDQEVLAGGRAMHPGRLALSCKSQNDTGLVASSRMLLGAVNPQEFGDEEHWYGVGGHLEVSVPRAGWYEFGLHGSSVGVLLKWLAISATR